MNTELRKFKKELREAFSDYVFSEGCSCCRSDDHQDHQDVISKLLNIPKDKDGCFDVTKYAQQKYDKLKKEKSINL